MLALLRRGLERGGWGVADQALSSLTNFAVGLLVARFLGPRDFGAFSLAFATYIVLLGASRALSTEPLNIRYSHRPDEWMAATSSATGVALLLGLAGSIVCVTVALLTGGSIGEAFLALSLTMPALLLQDAYRLSFFAVRRGKAAFISDAAWAVLLIPAFLVLASGGVTVFRATLAWGLSAAVAGAAGAVLAGVLPRFDVARWWGEHRDVSVPLLGEILTHSGGDHLSLFVIGAFTGLAGAGAFRAAEVLLGGVKVLSMGVMVFAVPEAARGFQKHPDQLRRTCVLIAFALASGAVFVGTILLLLPEAVGSWLMGPTWPVARPVIGPVAVSLAGAGATGGALVGLRALEAAGRSFRARVVVSLLTVGAAAVGAAVSGVVAAAWGMAAASWVGAAVWWRHLRDESLDRGIIRPSHEARLVTLPLSVGGRCYVPSVPPGAARTALLLVTPYRPITFLAWTVLRLFAGLGLLRLLRRVAQPALPHDDLLASYLPPGGHLAIRSGTARGRWAALIMTASGTPHVLLKVATTEDSQADLRAEADIQRQLSGRVPGALHIPKVILAADHMLVFEAIPLRPRLRSWRLPTEVAAALGEMTRAGLTHGDCAPWNLMRTKAGWYLIDWEAAQDRGLPWADVWHYLVQSHALVGLPTRRTILAGLNGRGWVGRALAAYSTGAGLPLKGAAHALRLHLEEAVTQADLHGRHLDDARRRRVALLAAVNDLAAAPEPADVAQ